MYNLSKNQKAQFQNFLNKVEGTMAGGNIKKWFDEVEPTDRVTSEQLEKLLSFQNGLPKELQSYPQSFAAWLKNGEDSNVQTGSFYETLPEEILFEKPLKHLIKKATDKKKNK